MAEETKSCKCYWWVLGIVALLGIIFILYQYTLTLRKNAEIAQQNLLAAKDSTRVYKTLYGNLSERYVEVIGKNDSLVKMLKEKDQEIIVYQQVNASLHLQLEATQIPVQQISENSLRVPLYDTYSDSGLTLSFTDSLRLERANIHSPWVAYSSPSFDIDMYYHMMIFRNEEGIITGSIETFSPYLKVTKLSTFFSDKYIPPPCTDEFPKTFGFTVGGSANYFDAGIMTRIGSWLVNPSYIISTPKGVDNPSWYDKIRLNIGYFIW